MTEDNGKQVAVYMQTDDEKITDLCSFYWFTEDGQTFPFKIKELCDLYQMTRNQLIKTALENSIGYSRTVSCSGCGCPLEFNHRSDFLNKMRNTLDNWECSGCRSAKDPPNEPEEDDEPFPPDKPDPPDHWGPGFVHFEKRFREAKEDAANGLEIDILSLESALYLLSFIRTTANEDMTTFRPHNTLNGSLISPTREFDIDILIHLFDEGVLIVDPHRSPPGSIENDNTYYVARVAYALPLIIGGPSVAKFSATLDHVIRSGDWPDGWNCEVDDLYRKIALHECLQYLRIKMEEHGFELRIGDKTQQVLEIVLNHFSIGQACSFIWRAVKDAAAFYMRKNVSKRHAANTIPGSIRRTADRAIAEDWEIQAYRRDYNAPQSELSRLFFDVVLKTGRRGFDKKPL
jgi:hypothetical protein